MAGEISEEFVLRQHSDRPDHIIGVQKEGRIAQMEIGSVMGHWQVWRYLIPLLGMFWILFAVILFTSTLFFLVGLIIFALLSFLVIILAWAYQNNL